MNVMLKRTKSANQSVIQDAVDSNNTSVTLAGPIQPDEDDYGYVSQEAAAYYNKMMEKYSKMPDEPKFNTAKKKVSNNLTSTKDRVRAALEKEKEEANMPHKRKRKVKENESDDFINDEEEMIKKPATKPKYKAPPPLNFNELLKLAEKKQFEPIVIETKPKEEERLLTKKQKKELEIERESKKRREQRNRDDALNKIPRLGEVKTVPQNLKKIDVNSPKAKSPVKSQIEKNVSTKVEITKKQINAKIPEVKKSHEVLPASIKYTPTPISKLKELNKPKYEPTKKIVSQQQENKVKIAPKDIKPKQFPPSDVRRNDLPPAGVKRKPPLLMKKGRILDEEDEEYDSEMDDFIDDGPEEDGDYSKYISEIFGYDKSKYRNADEDVDNMESTFAQQMREECISTKIGVLKNHIFWEYI